MIEKYEKMGKIGVLVSYGFGAGWSTWSNEYGVDLALDKRIIEKFLELCEKEIEYDQAKKEMKVFLESIGYNGVYIGGLDGLCLEMVDKGTSIKITEYDGAESLEYGYCDYTII